MTKRILLATDLSANSAFAAKWASNYAKLSGAQVVLAHIIEVSIPNWLRDAYTALEDDDQRQKLETRIHEWYHTHTGERAAEVKLAGGSIDSQLNTMVEGDDISLLVLARSGKSGLSKLLAGSTAQMMVANPPCPVVVVHPDHTGLDNASKIAVATDLTESAEKAISEAALMSTLVGGHLDIIHAAKFSASDIEDENVPENLRKESLQQATDEQMHKIIGTHSAELTDVNYTSHIIHAGPVDAVTQFAEDKNIDMVFVGNAAHYNMVTNVFGRVSVKLTQMLPCTVLVVPPDVAAAE